MEGEKKIKKLYSSPDSPSNRPEDFEAAAKLIEENELLRKDPYTKRVLRNEGRVDNGDIVDIGDFLAARLAVLENDKEKMVAAENKNPKAYQQALAVSSVRPDMERGVEGGK